MAGKLGGPARLNAVAAGQLVHILDQTTKRRFLVDTGASYSMLPHSSSSPANGPKLYGPAGRLIPCWGERRLNLRFQGDSFPWTFLLAAVDFPILGIDFLRHYHFLIDPGSNSLNGTGGKKYKTLSQAGPPAAFPVVLGSDSPWQPCSSLGVLEQAANRVVETPRSPLGVLERGDGERTAASAGKKTAAAAPYGPLLEEFPDVVCETKKLPPVSHDITHHIVTQGPPVHCKFRKLDPEKLAAAKKEFRQLEDDGLIRRSTSPWSSPLHMVPKPDGSWRPCGDFRRLNLVTEPDVYPLPNMLDFAAKAAGCTIFSKIDLRKGYHQIPVAPEDIPKTALATPFGLFEFVRMPFGLRNAQATFQRHVDKSIRDCHASFAWVDDIVICS